MSETAWDIIRQQNDAWRRMEPIRQSLERASGENFKRLIRKLREAEDAGTCVRYIPDVMAGGSDCAMCGQPFEKHPPTREPSNDR